MSKMTLNQKFEVRGTTHPETAQELLFSDGMNHLCSRLRGHGFLLSEWALKSPVTDWWSDFEIESMARWKVAMEALGRLEIRPEFTPGAADQNPTLTWVVEAPADVSCERLFEELRKRAQYGMERWTEDAINGHGVNGTNDRSTGWVARGLSEASRDLCSSLIGTAEVLRDQADLVLSIGLKGSSE